MRWALGVLALAGALACTDSFTPSNESVPGSYTATVFTTTDSTGTIDWIAAGGSLRLMLAPGDSASGRLFMPGGDSTGADIDVDMAGRWLLQGDIVEFIQDSSSFVREIPWIAGKNQLLGDWDFRNGRKVHVLLTK